MTIASIIYKLACQHFHRVSRLSTTVASMEEELMEVFKYKNTNISNWIIENKVRKLCFKYADSSKEEKQSMLRILANQYTTEHDNICQVAKKLVSIQPSNERQIFSYERSLKNNLTPRYHWLFIIIGRLEYGVKFLVDLRTDVLELMLETKDVDENIVIQQLNLTLQDLFLLWFSVGFLHLERITWQSACDILQKVSEYEAIHPIKNWVDLKRRVGPYRRCYIFTHPSMPREPIVVLHTALCNIIPDSVKGIGDAKQNATFLEEDKLQIKAAIFYSIASTQRGLQGIELGNYLIKEVANQITTEFPMINQLSSLSPIPNFRIWLLEKMKQDSSYIFTLEEYKSLQSILKLDAVQLALNKIFKTSLWTNDRDLCGLLKEPLLRACAWYLYREKRRNYALNSVANFHLRNGAVMWRINWMADPTPRGVANSCGIMVNYRYYLNDCERNSQNYIENYHVNASENVINAAAEAERLRTTQ
ncbi:hypothetical protein KM043_011264 [Ampulex compressa]|nr:hypothetical protein KM043_011264 [Ampulex compressa]